MERYKETLRNAINRARVSPNPLLRWSVDAAQLMFRVVGWAIPALHLGWVSALRSAHWDGDDLVVSGWGYVRGGTYGTQPQYSIYLGRRFVPPWLGGVVARAEARPKEDLDVLGAALRAERDYRDMGWEATFPAAALARLRTGRWQLRAKVHGGGRWSGGRVKLVYFFGSPAVVPARLFGENLLSVQPHQLPQGGADIVVRPAGPSVLEAAVTGRVLRVVLDPGQSADRALLRGRGQEEVALSISRDGDGVVLAGEIPPGKAVVDRQSKVRFPPAWTIVVDGEERPVMWTGGSIQPRHHGEPVLRAAQDGSLEIVDVPFFVEVDAVARVDEELRITGTLAGDAEGFRLVLAAPRAEIPVTLRTVGEDGRFTATSPLRVPVWGGPDLPPARGAYVLEGRRTDATGNAARFATFASRDYIATVPAVVRGDDVQVRFELNQQPQALVRVNRPRQVDEYGSFNQALLFTQYAMEGSAELDAVYFESFFGRGATCNPRAIDAEVARRRPELPRYWSVDDLSVAVPEGAIPLVIGTREWWQVRESARWIVTNEWLRGRYVKKRHQTVLQTWHGSMYKRIGIDRGGAGFLGGGHVDRARAERANWDMFISQNADTTPIIIQAYEFEADPAAVLEIGYPRNDELFGVESSRVRGIRERLGIPEGTTVVMYAPTWREPGQKVELLNLVKLARDLGPGFTFLQRGHVRTLEEGEAVTAAAVIDASTYPQINDLYIASDVLITDYSSMMFDFSVTGRPMLFYTPDIEEYTDPKVRGAYFDLEEVAPGPVVRTPGEVVESLQSFDWSGQFAGRYAAWKQRFNHADDGNAAGRAVDALFAFDPSQRQGSTRRRLFDPSAGEDA
ncbi:MAG TPA: CDP-glycerol glycerophosphotransferase family protein [Aeromicrobium sp.]|nr:CDP-glycerol glycerophosphotransferase family protein [Aeromicrobium sp.]